MDYWIIIFIVILIWWVMRDRSTSGAQEHSKAPDRVLVKLDNRLVDSGANVPLVWTKTKPTLSYDKRDDFYYHVIMVDESAPNADNPKFSPFLHWLKINVTKDQAGQELVTYFPPNPPPGSGAHHYTINVYFSDHAIQPRLETNMPRNNFKLEKFLDNNQLKYFASFNFQTAAR